MDAVDACAPKHTIEEEIIALQDSGYGVTVVSLHVIECGNKQRMNLEIYILVTTFSSTYNQKKCF